MPTVAQRLATLLSNLEAESKTIDPAAPHHRLFLELQELVEIVSEMHKQKSS